LEGSGVRRLEGLQHNTTMTDNQDPMQITVKRKNVYGKDLIYPVCEKAECLTMLADTKTFTPYQILIIKALVYKVLVQRDEEEEL
jgi:hypothetical protein